MFVAGASSGQSDLQKSLLSLTLKSRCGLIDFLFNKPCVALRQEEHAGGLQEGLADG